MYQLPIGDRAGALGMAANAVVVQNTESNPEITNDFNFMFVLHGNNTVFFLQRIISFVNFTKL
jgi:hypothetical protein